MKFPDTPFWDFSIAVYSKPGVGPACLVLQGRHQIDVNILLFCLWLAHDGYPAATEAEMKRYVDAVGPWHQQAVRRLRAVRKWMKPSRPPVDDALAKSVRAAIQKIEIDAEHLEQITLHNCVQAHPIESDLAAKLAHAASNIDRYFAATDVGLGPEDIQPLSDIFASAFPGATEAEVASAVGNIHVIQ